MIEQEVEKGYSTNKDYAESEVTKGYVQETS